MTIPKIITTGSKWIGRLNVMMTFGLEVAYASVANAEASTNQNIPFLSQLAALPKQNGLRQITAKTGYKINYLYDPSERSTVIAFYDGEANRLIKLDTSGEVLSEVSPKGDFSPNTKLIFQADGFSDWYRTRKLEVQPFAHSHNSKEEMSFESLKETFTQLYRQASIVEYFSVPFVNQDGTNTTRYASVFLNSLNEEGKQPSINVIWTSDSTRGFVMGTDNEKATNSPLTNEGFFGRFVRSGPGWDDFHRKTITPFKSYTPQVSDTARLRSPSKLNGIEVRLKSLKTVQFSHAGHPGIPVFLNCERIGSALVELKSAKETLNFQISNAVTLQWFSGTDLGLQIYHQPVGPGEKPAFVILELKNSRNTEREGTGLYVLRL